MGAQRLVGVLVVVLTMLCAGVAARQAIASMPAAPIGTPQVDPRQVGGGLFGTLLPGAEAATPQHEASAAAVADRAASATRYGGLGAADAVELGRKLFPELVGRPSWQPLALPSGARVLGYHNDERSAEVVDPSGRRVVMSANVPLRAQDRESGLLAPVDLSLERSEGAFVPAVSSTAVKLADDPSEGMSVGPIGLSVVGATGTAQPVRVDDTVVWPNAVTDTDIIAQVVPGGVELSLALRSIQSPQDVTVRFKLPAGATLRAVAPGKGDGLEIVGTDGTLITTISSPVAWDAEHVPVTARWLVRGTDATLQVDTAGKDIAWPVAVDPVINDNRYNCDLAVRHWTPVIAGAYGVSAQYGDWGWGCGMYQSLPNPTWVSFPDGVFSFWQLSLAGRPTANIRQVHAENMNHDSGANAIGGPATCTYLNIWSATSIEYPWTPRCDTYRGALLNVGNWTVDNGNRADSALVGLVTAGAGTRGYFQQSVGVLVAALGDSSPPVAGITGPVGWRRVTTASFTGSGNDTGLGTSGLTVTANGFTQTFNGSCPETADICSAGLSGTTTRSSLPEGVRTATATATDPTGQTGTASTTYAIDTSKPTMTLSGALFAAKDTSIDAGVYPLTISAADGNAGSASTARSGVASITTFVDNVQVDVITQGCATTYASCPLTRTWNFQPGLYGPGLHTIKVVVRDQVGNDPTEQSFSVTADCCFGAAAQWNGTATTGDVLFGDVNGDDLDDAVLRNTSTGAVTVEISNGTSLANPVAWGTWPTSRDINVYDIDDDGRADLVGRDGTGTVSWAKSTGSAFGTAATLTTLASSYSVMRVGDVDGDRSGDIVGENPSTGAIQIVLTDGTAATDRIDGSTWPTGYTFILRDIDGDGVDDAVGRNITTGAVQVGFSHDTGFETRGGPWTIPANADFNVADVNGDGLNDLLYRPSGSDLLYVRDGVNDASSSTFLTGQIWGRWPQTRAVAAADLTGDDRADLIARDSSTSAFWAAVSQGQAPQGETSDADPVPAIASIASLNPALPASCQSSSVTKLAFVDDGRFLYNSGDASEPAPDPANAAQRIAALGAEVVRLTVYWGQVEISPGVYNWSRLDTAVAAIRNTHIANDANCPNTLAVHMTLTGQRDRSCKPAFNPNSRDCTGQPSTGVNPSPAAFKAFVQAVVTHFDGLVGSYSMWNEPNLPSHYFLATGLNPGGKPKKELTAALYRELYVAGYSGAQTAFCQLHDCSTNADQVPVLIGELSEQRNHDKPVGGVAAHKGGFSALDYLYEVVRPPTTSSLPVKTMGVALHPYQHSGQPSDRGTPGDVGVGKLRAPLLPSSTKAARYNRVGVLEALTSLRNLTGPNGSETGAPWLRTPTGGAAPLYLTEFGYFNLPVAKAPPATKHGSWYTENTRVTRFVGDSSHQGALTVARLARPQWMTIYAMTESAKLSPNGIWEGGFDTGLIGRTFQADWSDVTGQRPYGKSPNGRSTNTAQTRKVYCAIYHFADDAGYPVQAGVPCP